MKKRKQIFLLFFFIFLFIILAPFIILYSMGFVFDFSQKKFIQTGAFYIKVYPKKCKVYLNGKFIKRTDPFLGTAVIKNLKPGSYLLEVKKEGFNSWKKKLEIKENIITKAENIFLFPEKINLSLLTKDVENFFPFKEREILLKKGNKENWYLALFDLKNSKEKVVLAKENLKDEKLSLGNIIILNKENVILEFKNKKGENHFYLLDFSLSSLKKINLQKRSKDIIFYPFSKEKLILKNGEGFFEYNLKEGTLSPVFKSDIVSFFPLKDFFLLLSKNGFLYKNNFEGEIIEILNEKPLHLKEGKKYEIISNDSGSYVFIKECGKKCNLYFLNENGFFFEKIFNQKNIKDIIFSPKSNKVLIFLDHEIWILFPKQPSREKERLVFLTRFSKKIKEVFWINEYYIIFNTKEKIKISEIDWRDGLNIVDLITLKNKKIFLMKDLRLLILGKEGDFFSTPNSLID